MRFLCKKCGAQSPGDLSEVAILEGALVFTCKTCGANATLVESRDPEARAARAAAGANPAEKGIVEPDEGELVDLGQATISRMLGKNVRIVTEAAPTAEAPGLDMEPAPEPEEKPPGPESPVLLAGETHSSRGRFAVGVVAGLALAAVITFALLEARQPAPSESGKASLATATKPVEVAAALPPPATREEPRRAEAESTRLPAAPPGAPAPARRAAEEPQAVIVRELKVEKAATPAPSSLLGPPAEHVEEAFWRIRPGVRMCANQERRRNGDAKLGQEAVTVTFAPTGEVQRVSFASAGFEGTALGECLAVELRKARIEPFEGQPAAVRRVLSLAAPGGTTD